MSYPHYSTECSEFHGLVVDFGGPCRRIITLCGSTKFPVDFAREQRRLTMEGHIVISVGVFGHADPSLDWGTDDEPSVLKVTLDEVHKRKIDLSDEIFVINPGGYIGSSTRGEIAYAEVHGKRVEYMEPVGNQREATS